MNGTLAHNRLAQRVFWIIPTINRVDFRGGELTPRDGPPSPDPDTPEPPRAGRIALLSASGAARLFAPLTDAASGSKMAAAENIFHCRQPAPRLVPSSGSET